ncbi:MAG: hypothetical protein QHI48_06135 [Bacteroidota bacterium]|nr:hypothetical protein [Bacteroidota bacterium]
MLTECAKKIYVYTCLNAACRAVGVTDREPTFSREIFGHFCPKCLTVTGPGVYALYCTVCRGVTERLDVAEPTGEEAEQKERILFADGCNRCGKAKGTILLRSTLLPQSGGREAPDAVGADAGHADGEETK